MITARIFTELLTEQTTLFCISKLLNMKFIKTLKSMNKIYKKILNRWWKLNDVE